MTSWEDKVRLTLTPNPSNQDQKGYYNDCLIVKEKLKAVVYENTLNNMHTICAFLCFTVFCCALIAYSLAPQFQDIFTDTVRIWFLIVFI